MTVGGGGGGDEMRGTREHGEQERQWRNEQKRWGGGVPNIKKTSGRPCIMAQGMGTQRIFVMLGTWVKCNNLLKIYCIFFGFFYLWKLPPTLAPAVYSHGSVTKQLPRNCEAPASKPCRCAILVPFCGALILITVIYELRA